MAAWAAAAAVAPAALPARGAFYDEYFDFYTEDDEVCPFCCGQLGSCYCHAEPLVEDITVGQFLKQCVAAPAVRAASVTGYAAAPVTGYGYGAPASVVASSQSAALALDAADGPVEQIVEMVVQAPVERVIEKVVQVPRKVPVSVRVEVPVPHEIVKTVDVPVPHEVVRSVDVPVPVERIVEKVVQLPVPVHKKFNQHVQEVVEPPEPYPIDKVVEVPQPYPVQKIVERRVDVPQVVQAREERAVDRPVPTPVAREVVKDVDRRDVPVPVGRVREVVKHLQVQVPRQVKQIQQVPVPIEKIVHV